MTLAPLVLSELMAAAHAQVESVSAVGGGCVSPAYRVRLEGGASVFVKTAPASGPADMLVEEARSLRVLTAAGRVRVPQVLHAGHGWLALEWLEPARGTRASWAGLGRSVAGLHRVCAAACGWETDSYIGPLPQRNGAAASWAEFWRERRLRVQLERARHWFDAPTLRQLDDVMDQLDEVLAVGDGDGASLLHGDLWGGNVHMSVSGPTLIDPASYYGHREVDIAMAALFGGFAPEFFAAYEAAWPLEPGAWRRRHIYQLYYLLVHVNLFGGGYVASAVTAITAAADGRR
ncbi:MAG TPA: fructosamine kinase family protein [Longimicrobiales bacterium]|nr:fructosamine kinase family protein [Longimicrobiales bacterium]